MKIAAKIMATAMAVAFALGTMTSANALSRKPQDNLFYGAGTDPTGLDPALVDDSYSGFINFNIYESLLRFKDGSLEIEPCLAESWTISEDGLVYTFKLRQDVKFHDGTPFNAEAVKFNVERQLPEKRTAKMAFAPLVYGDVAKVEALDEYTVAFTLNKRSTPFLRNLAMAFGAPVASPTALKANDNNLMNAPCGTGPYKFVAWDRGQQVILTTNEDYWGEKPPVQNVIFRIIKETSARVVALNNGEVDAINGVDANVVSEIEAAGNIVGHVNVNSVNYLLFNHRDGYVTKDLEVRKAIAQAINIPEMVQTLYKGYFQPAHSFLTEMMPGYDKDIKFSEYNPEAAQKFFAERGIKELTFITSSNTTSSNPVGGQVLAEAIQAYLAKVGVNVSILAYDWATFKSKLTTDDWDISFIGWAGDNGDPDNFINFLARNDAMINQGLWQNKEFIDLVDKGVDVLDGPEREAIYRRAEQVMAEDLGVLPLYHPVELIGYRPNISGNFMHSLGLTYFGHVTKTVQ